MRDSKRQTGKIARIAAAGIDALRVTRVSGAETADRIDAVVVAGVPIIPDRRVTAPKRCAFGQGIGIRDLPLLRARIRTQREPPDAWAGRDSCRRRRALCRPGAIVGFSVE